MREPPILNKVAVAHPDTSFFLKKVPLQVFSCKPYLIF